MTALPIAMASRIVVTPAWKSFVVQRNDDELGPRVQIAQLAVWIGAGRSRWAQRAVFCSFLRLDQGLAAARQTSTSRSRTASMSVG